MVIKIGLIGYSNSNGHPYSFGSIINGFHPLKFDPEWDIIKTYLSSKPSSDFLSGRAVVKKIWCQDAERAKKIQDSCQISELCGNYEELIDQDAIIIARDDWIYRNKILKFFLESGIPCFCDKPLTANRLELDALIPYLSKGLLYTGSGFRYAYEVDIHKKDIKSSGYISAHVVNDLVKYGIHMLDLLFSVKDCDLQQATLLNGTTDYPIYELVLSDNSVFRLTCSSFLQKTFKIDYLSANTSELKTFTVSDNFTAFRRTLSAFLDMVETGINIDSTASTRSLTALSMLYSQSQ